MKTITIDGRRFEVKKLFNLEFMGEDIYEVYNKPSQNKIVVWEDWERWFGLKGICCYINSYNSSTFTIGAYILYTHLNGKKYSVYFKITPVHNYIRYEEV